MKTKFDNYKYMYLNLWKWNKSCYFLCVIRSVLLVVLPLCVALIPKIIIDLVTYNVSTKRFIYIIVSISLLICLFSWIEPYIKEKLAAITENSRVKYRIAAFEKLLKMPYHKLESNEEQQKYEKAKMFIYSGKYMQLLDFLDINTTFFSSLLGIIFYTFIITSINPVLIIFILIICVLEYFLTLYLKKFEFKIIEKEIGVYTKFDYLYKISVDDKYGKDIRLFSAQKYFITIVDDLLKMHSKMMSYITKKTINFTTIEAVVALIRDYIIYFFLILSVIKNKIEISDFIFLFGITTGFTGWISALSLQMINFYEINKQCAYYRDFVLLKPEDDSSKYGVNLDTINKIEFKNVFFSYDGINYILNNINFVINSGESVALVGCNGAGKTTIIKLLCGFYKPQKGNIFINNIDINQIKKDSLLKLISAVFQDFSFIPMDIQSNIAMEDLQNIDTNRLVNVSKQAGIYNKIVELDNTFNTKMIKQVYENAVDFSGGENQKLLLARALYKKSDLLILDEPTSALDPIAESKIYDEYKKMMSNKISIFVSHRLASTQFCDRILFLKNGCISEEGTHNELLNNKSDYWKMFMTQSYYYKKERKADE